MASALNMVKLLNWLVGLGSLLLAFFTDGLVEQCMGKCTAGANEAPFTNPNTTWPCEWGSDFRNECGFDLWRWSEGGRVFDEPPPMAAACPHLFDGVSGDDDPEELSSRWFWGMDAYCKSHDVADSEDDPSHCSRSESTGQAHVTCELLCRYTRCEFNPDRLVVGNVFVMPVVVALVAHMWLSAPGWWVYPRDAGDDLTLSDGEWLWADDPDFFKRTLSNGDTPGDRKHVRRLYTFVQNYGGLFVKLAMAPMASDSTNMFDFVMAIMLAIGCFWWVVFLLMAMRSLAQGSTKVIAELVGMMGGAWVQLGFPLFFASIFMTVQLSVDGVGAFAVVFSFVFDFDKLTWYAVHVLSAIAAVGLGIISAVTGACGS